MRIIGGQLRGRRLEGKPGPGTRPTSDRVREALASALLARGAIDDARVLDLYAGTGALSFEALSRGARDALLVERDRKQLRQIQGNVKGLGLEGRARAVALDLAKRPADVAQRLGPGPFDLVFADPPYAHIGDLMPLLDYLSEHKFLHDDALVVVESARDEAPASSGPLERVADYRYGSTSVAFYTPRRAESAGEFR